MLYIEFSKLPSSPSLKIDMMDDYPLPINFKFGLSGPPYEKIYTRNFVSEVKIEMQFDKDSRRFYDISIITLPEESIPHISLSGLNVSSEDYYACLINPEKTQKLEDDHPLSVFRDNNSFIILWPGNEVSNLEFFAVAPGIFVGMNQQNIFSAMLFRLEAKYIAAILNEK